MEAESRNCPSLRRWAAAICIASTWLTIHADAASFRTRNFIIQAPSPQLARSVGEAAERYRDDLAVYWTGKPLHPWPNPCPIRVVAGPNLAAQGVTTYQPQPVRDFQMEVVGTPERIIDSVLPHEVTHTVLATHFGRPLPRWADEGICTTVEHASERNKHEVKLREFLRSRRGIPMNRLFQLTEYPNDVLPMYAQGYSVCRFLIEQKGPQTFISFLKDYMRHPSWTANVKRHYDYASLGELQEYWLKWVSSGSGPVDQFAKATPPKTQPKTQTDQPTANSSIAQVSATSDPQLNPPKSGWLTQPGDAKLASAATGQPGTPPTPGRTAPGRTAPGRTAPGRTAPGPTAPGGATASLTPARATPIEHLAAIDSTRRPPAAVDGAGAFTAAPPRGGSTPLNGLEPEGGLSTQSASSGWYRRQAVAAHGQPGSSAVRTMAPPSVRESGRYSMAQPQPESQISRARLPDSQISGSFAQPNQAIR